MRILMGLALVAMATATACKKAGGVRGGASGSGSALSPDGIHATAAASATVAPSLASSGVANAPTAWHVPTGAGQGDSNADASALGTRIAAHLVERTYKVADNGAREVVLLLVLEGNGAIVADVTEEGLAQDGRPDLNGLPQGADLPLSALSPPRPFAASDAARPLDFTGPLLFLAHFESPAEKRDLAIAQVPDGIGVWTMIAASDAIDVAPAWERTGSIKLAHGAIVTAPADAARSARAAPVPASTGSSPGAGAGAPPASALDRALNAKGIDVDLIASRASGTHSQWAIIKGALHPLNAMPLKFDIWRASTAGIATLTLTPPASPASSWFDELTSIEVKDVDGDAIDDAVIATKWSRQLSGKSRSGKLVTTEHVDALYVVGGAALVIGGQHAARYTTETNLGEGENPQPEESLVFRISIANGSPPKLHTETVSNTTSKLRVKGLLNPTHDAWLIAGDQPIIFGVR